MKLEVYYGRFIKISRGPLEREHETPGSENKCRKRENERDQGGTTGGFNDHCDFHWS